MNALETIQELERLQKENETLQNELLKQKQKLSDIRINTDRINPTMYELQNKQFEYRLKVIERYNLRYGLIGLSFFSVLMIICFILVRLG